VMMFCIVALVLLIACANIANLQLARGIARRHELSLRLALGASRWRLARQLLTESLVMAILGATAGLAFATWANRALVAQLSTFATPVVLDLAVDWRVLAFTIAVAVVTSVVFGLVPAMTTTGHRVARFVSTAGRGAVGPGGTRVRKTLVVCEMALAVILLIGAGLLIRSYQRISIVDPGFSADHLLTFTVSLPEQKYRTSAEAGRFMRDLVARLADGMNSQGAELACAASGGQPHPVIGLWPVRLREDLRHALIAEGIRKVDVWTERYRLATVDFPVTTIDPFFNANRPEDLDRAAALLAETTP